MRLPQDRILHIGTEIKDGKVNIVAEWQGELVRCKDCKQYIVEGITTRYGWCHENKHPVDEDDFCSMGEREKE